MQLHFLIPGDINTLTGGYIYNKRMVNGLLNKGHQVEVHSLMNDFPFPSPESKKKCAETLFAIPKGDFIIIDSIVFGAIPDLLKKIKRFHPIIALIHLPLSMGTGYSADQRSRLLILENEAFEYADLIIVTSAFTRNLLIEMGINPSRLVTIIPGAEALLHKQKYCPIPRKFITVSNYTPNKGYLLLINALSELKHLKWTLDCYGNPEFDPEYFKELSDLITHNNLTEKIFLHTAVSGKELSEAYVNSDLLIHPSEFETYGMVLTEALSHGIPVVASLCGAISQTLQSSMGVFFEVNDQISLQNTIKIVLQDETRYQKLCNEAASYKPQLWEKSISEFEKSIVSAFYKNDSSRA